MKHVPIHRWPKIGKDIRASNVKELKEKSNLFRLLEQVSMSHPHNITITKNFLITQDSLKYILYYYLLFHVIITLKIMMVMLLD